MQSLFLPWLYVMCMSAHIQSISLARDQNYIKYILSWLAWYLWYCRVRRKPTWWQLDGGRTSTCRAGYMFSIYGCLLIWLTTRKWGLHYKRWSLTWNLEIIVFSHSISWSSTVTDGYWYFCWSLHLWTLLQIQKLEEQFWVARLIIHLYRYTGKSKFHRFAIKQ